MHHINITRIKAVHHALRELGNEVVFVGGATVSLYSDTSVDDARPTDDVDILVEVANRFGYFNIEEKLRERGFVNDSQSGVICRYEVQGITVDVMPTSPDILGFSNVWYKDGFATSTEYEIPGGPTINIFRPEYLLATKLEAFKSRGQGDGRTSNDFSDIVFVLNNRTVIWEELKKAKPEIRDYLRKEFKRLSETEYFDEWLEAHLDYKDKPRQVFILTSLEQFLNTDL
ncbi:MAG: nucleotidyl transferase AbiEii/AbiGii toxin family protein [Bacteroidota bacterium]